MGATMPITESVSRGFRDVDDALRAMRDSEGALRAAAQLLQRGLSVIPIQPFGKRALVPWRPYQRRRASCADLAAWSRAYPTMNLGIVTGSISNLVVIDCDDATAVAWAEHHLPATPMVTQTSGGRHLFYRAPSQRVTNRVGVRLDDGRRLRIDVRGSGGYVVVPPSVHPSGARYVRVGPWPALSDLPVFDPAWLPQAPRTPSAAATPRLKLPPSILGSLNASASLRRARAWMAKRDPAIAGRGGDVRTFITACNLVREFGLDDADALDLLRVWNCACVPPWSDVELVAKIRNARRHGRSGPSGARFAP